MTATLALPPVLATAVVNGLVGVAVLDVVPCPTCDGRGKTYWWCRIATYEQIRQTQQCPTCGGSGTVAPSVEPGQRLTIAAVGDLPDLGRLNDGWYVDQYDDGIAMDDAEDFPLDGEIAERRIWLHTRKVVGSAVAITPALPITRYGDKCPDDGPHFMVATDGARRALYLCPGEEGGVCKRLDAALPWLPSDLVGRWAVLVEDAATTEQRCPTCWGYNPTPTSRPPCPTCDDRDLWGPVPLPDGFDPEPYTLTELELT